MCFIHSQALFKRTSRSEKTTLELHRYSPSPCGVSMDSGVRRHDAARREFSLTQANTRTYAYTGRVLRDIKFALRHGHGWNGKMIYLFLEGYSSAGGQNKEEITHRPQEFMPCRA
jgi:hypothetical protein